MSDPAGNRPHRCAEDCSASARPVLASPLGVSRRQFLGTSAAGALALGTTAWPHWAVAQDSASGSTSAESLVKVLYDTLTPGQREKVCFAWDYVDPMRGLLRTRVANNWQITEAQVNSDFYTDDQRKVIRDIFEAIIHPDWHARIDKQLEDDAGGYGEDQSLAIFGLPGQDKFEFVMTGRHMTIRADGNSTDHMAFGGPIFYGHAADGFNESPSHPGNVFWPQALAANEVFKMLDGQQRKLALVPKLPPEQAVAFRGQGRPGIPVSELSSDQLSELEKTLAALVAPYRPLDQQEVAACLAARGGLKACSLAFYQEGDLGNDQVWDCFRLEGPAFVWYFRGAPHVHGWVHIADDPSVPLNA